MSTIPCKVCNDLKPSLAEAVWCEMQHEAGAPSKAATPTPRAFISEFVLGYCSACKLHMRSSSFQEHECVKAMPAASTPTPTPTISGKEFADWLAKQPCPSTKEAEKILENWFPSNTPTPPPPQTPPEEGIEGEKCECKPVVQSNGFEAHSFRCPVYRSNLRTFVCPHCAARITDLYGIAEGCFQAHLREYHGNPDASPPPKDRIITQENYRDETHYWSCHSCDTGFSDKDAAMKHECERGPFAKQPSPPPLAQTLQERGERYGDFETECTLNQNIMTAFEHSKNWRNLPALQKHALTMIAMKITRVLNGDADYPDNFRDIAGYAALAERSLGGGKNQ